MKIQKTPKIKIIALMLSATMLIGSLYAYIVCSASTKIERDFDISAYSQESENLTWEISNVATNGALTQINGYIFDNNSQLYTYNTNIVLKNTTTNEYIKLHTQMEVREDIPKKDPTNPNDFSNVGFASLVTNKDLPPANYEICIAYGNNGSTNFIHTDSTLSTSGGIKNEN